MMDGSHFDALTRTLSTAGSRRRALAGLLAGALGLLGRGDMEEAAAHNTLKKCKKLKDKKKKKACLKKAKKHNATHTSPPPTSGGGGGGGGGGSSSPPPPPPAGCTPECSDTVCCGQACVDTQTNASHCGACDTPCPTEAPETCGETGTCSNGTCALYASGTICQQRYCTSSVVQEGRCDGTGTCVQKFVESCEPGRCDAATGQCTLSCASDSDCDPKYGWCNAGTCQFKQGHGTTCSPSTPQQCYSGHCVDGVCCISACVEDNATGDCTTGFCTLTCNDGWGNCDGDMGTNGCETNLLRDWQHCGACNQPCSGPCGPNGSGILDCQSGACVCTF